MYYIEAYFSTNNVHSLTGMKHEELFRDFLEVRAEAREDWPEEREKEGRRMAKRGGREVEGGREGGWKRRRVEEKEAERWRVEEKRRRGRFTSPALFILFPHFLFPGLC